jgi:hypothetical protein
MRWSRYGRGVTRLDVVFALLRDPERLAAQWRERDMFEMVGGDALEITVGQPGGAALARVAKRFEESGHGLPRLLREFLERHDGFNVREIEGSRSQLIVGGDGYGNGLVCSEAIELEALPGDDEPIGLRIGMVFNQGSVILVLEGPLTGAVVYPCEDYDAPLILANSIEALFDRLGEEGLSLDKLVPF